MLVIPRIDKIYDIAMKNGAIGGKVTGAGGGGHMLFYCEKLKQKKLQQKLQTLGLERVKFYLIMLDLNLFKLLTCQIFNQFLHKINYF